MNRAWDILNVLLQDLIAMGVDLSEREIVIDADGFEELKAVQWDCGRFFQRFFYVDKRLETPIHAYLKHPLNGILIHCAPRIVERAIFTLPDRFKYPVIWKRVFPIMLKAQSQTVGSAEPGALYEVDPNPDDRTERVLDLRSDYGNIFRN